MNNEIKLNNVQIVLFFENEINYNALELASTISKEIPQLGQPNIFNLPNDIPNEIRVQTPKIIFSNAKELNVTISALNARLNVIGENTSEELKEFIDLVYDALISQNIKINSIGLVSEYICFDVDFEKIKNQYYKDELASSKLVNSSWFNKEENLNIWKSLKVQEKNGKKILSIVSDVNNRGNKETIDKENVNIIVDKSKEISEKFKEKIKGELEK